MTLPREPLDLRVVGEVFMIVVEVLSNDVFYFLGNLFAYEVKLFGSIFATGIVYKFQRSNLRVEADSS